MVGRYPFAIAPFKFEGHAIPYDESAAPRDDGVVDDRITLPSGTDFYAHGLVVGIDANGEVSEGWDGGVETGSMSAEDRRALADMMIERWQQFRDKA